MFYSLGKHQAKITVVIETRNSLICAVFLVKKLYYMHKQYQGNIHRYTGQIQQQQYSHSYILAAKSQRNVLLWKACYDGDKMLFTVK